jgi:hypothetical protein
MKTMMKKIIIYLSLVLVPVILYSNKVDVETANKIARKVYKMDMPDKSQTDVMKFTPLSLEGDTLLYVFSYPDDGYVIISSDDAAPPVLGHCTNGKFVPDDMPPGLLFLIEKYKYSIVNLKKNKAKPSKRIEDQWVKYLGEGYAQLKSYNIGDHLLSTTWGQQSGYNSNCPTGCPAGCTAVAMAQILRYWECRIDPTGIVDYSGTGWEGGYANIGTTTYNWLNMNSSIDDANNALLISHAGISCQTHYKTTGST